MIIKSIEIESFRAFENASFSLGKRITAIAGRNATQKTTVLGMIGQPFTISLKDHTMYGCQTIDGYNFKSQFKEKFKISPTHDLIGSHKWKLNLHNNIYKDNSFSVASIPRTQSGKAPSLRFWNAKSRKKGDGYIQLPVYFLSLSRLFPIGEAGNTKSFSPELTDDELTYCIREYRTILSIQSNNGASSVGIEKGSSSKTFMGVSDDNHDIFTNSAGEGNIVKIILAVLSFRRLQEKYGRDYKGGILLIDEIDATLYGFSQIKLVEFLWKVAGDYKLQIVFTTHSPLILKSVNKLQRKEFQSKGISLPSYAYDSSIVYLEPKYDSEGKRTIMPKNINSSNELNSVLNDINLTVPVDGTKVNIYCEDIVAVQFVQYLLKTKYDINLELYMNFVDINLGWTNYIQLAEKKVPEFRNNIIILDGDVPQKREYRTKSSVVSEAGNFLFLPLVIEKDLFELLKNHSSFNDFITQYCKSVQLNYDICFNNWPLESTEYNTSDFKKWFNDLKTILGGSDLLFKFWIDQNSEKVNTFINGFIAIFNDLADKKEVDTLPDVHYTQENLTEN